MSRSDRILWCLPKWPLPMQDGARVANINLLKGLTSLGEKVDLLCVAGEDENCDVEELRRVCGIQECFIVRRRTTGARTGVKGMAEALRFLVFNPWLAITLAPFSTRSVRVGIFEVLSKRRWSALVYDGLHSAAHSALATGVYTRPSDVPRVIYRAHNVESEIWKRKSALIKFLPLRWFFSMQTYLMKRFEESLVRVSDAVMTVSETDLDLFRKTVPEIRGESVPIGYDFGEAPTASRSTDQVLFLGRLDWPPNRDGLVWLLEKVWPEARRQRPALELCIVGSGSSNWLEAFKGMPGVKFLGRVEKLDEVYRDSLVSLVPVFYGSGTRVKAIEASRYGRACLSTAVGVEGLGLEGGTSFIQAETAQEWIEALVQLNPQHSSQIGQKAHDLLKQSFHLPVAAKKFLTRVY